MLANTKNTMSSVKKLVTANTIGAEEIEIMTKERPEESVKREEELQEAMSLPMKKNEDSEKKEKIPTAAPPPPLP